MSTADWQTLLNDTTFQHQGATPSPSDTSELADFLADDCDTQDYQTSPFMEWPSVTTTTSSSSYPQQSKQQQQQKQSQQRQQQQQQQVFVSGTAIKVDTSVPSLRPEYSSYSNSATGSYESSSLRSDSMTSHDAASPTESISDQDRKMRRQKQNRAAQRAFRERRQQQTRVLLERVKELEKANRQLSTDYDEAKRKLEALRDQMDGVQSMVLKYWFP